MEWFKAYPILNFLLGTLFTIAIGWKAVKELIVTYREQIKELRVERDDYRTNLHSSRNEHQKALGKIAEYELQPDLSTLQSLLESQAMAMSGIGKSSDAMAESLMEHMKEDHIAFAAINTNMEQTNKGLTNLFGYLKKHDQRVAARTRKAKVS